MIPRKRQAAPQAPAREFKPRKNGTPAVPATPPANMPSPAPAPQMQQPPMRGAARSMGRAPQQEQRAPQRAPERAQGRFNPMQGPMGAGMDRARQAAATMFMDRAPKPMQPSMPQQPKTPPPAMPSAMPQRQMQPAAQSAMQRAPQKAPKPQQTSQPQDFSPAQQAALDIAGMVPEQATIKLGAVGSDPEEKDMGEIIAGLEKQLEQKQKSDVMNAMALVPAVDPSALGAFDITPEMFEAAKQAAEFASETSTIEQLEQKIADLLSGESEGIYTEDEIQAQVDALKKDAAAAKQDLAMKMAMRGMGASGLAGAGFGNIDAELIGAINELAIQNKALGIERDLKELGITGPLLANLLNDETRRMIAEREFDYKAEQDKMSNESIFLNNIAAEIGAEKWDPASAAEVARLLAEGVPSWEIKKYITKSKGGTAFYDGDIDPSEYDGTESGFGKETASDWTSAVLGDPELLAEEQESLDQMLVNWKQSVPNPTKFSNAEDWLDYYFGEGADLASMNPDELKEYFEERKAAGKAFISVKGVEEFAPPGFEGMDMGDGEPVPWSNLSPAVKQTYWSYFNQGKDILGSDPSDVYFTSAQIQQADYEQYLKNLGSNKSTKS